MRIYLFDQPFVSISSPSSTSDFAITLSIVPLLNSLASVKTFSLFSRAIAFVPPVAQLRGFADQRAAAQPSVGAADRRSQSRDAAW